MRRLGALILVAGAIGAVALVLARRARESMEDSVPAAPSAPVHMSVGAAAPEVPTPDDPDIVAGQATAHPAISVATFAQAAGTTILATCAFAWVSRFLESGA